MKYGAAELEAAFADHLRAIACALTELDAQYMLIGGLAVGVWCEPRATKDIDLAVAVKATPAELSTCLKKAGLAIARGDLDRALAQGESIRLKALEHEMGPVVVDLLFSGTPFEIEALSRSVPALVFGIEIPIVSPEDLFIYKVIAGRPQDLADADSLQVRHGAAFDHTRIRRWAEEFGAEATLESVIRGLRTRLRSGE